MASTGFERWKQRAEVPRILVKKLRNASTANADYALAA